MPDPEVASRLRDVEDCCTAIAEHLGNVTFEQFVRNRTIRSAVERELITIGEAMRALLQTTLVIEAQVTDPRGIVDLRNVLVHGYRRLDPRIIWTLAQTEVPVLAAEVGKLISSQE
jgi:uncharacterized protein with HEPN domain